MYWQGSGLEPRFRQNAGLFVIRGRKESPRWLNKCSGAKRQQAFPQGRTSERGRRCLEGIYRLSRCHAPQDGQATSAAVSKRCFRSERLGAVGEAAVRTKLAKR